jgi:hypothetical protein
MTLKASVMLAAILTVALSVLALRESFWCYVSTGVAILMIWRGEAWKAAFLESEQRVSELQRQLRQPISSSRESLSPDSLIRDDARRSVVWRVSLQLADATCLDPSLSRCALPGCKTHLQSNETHGNALPVQEGASPVTCLDPFPFLPGVESSALHLNPLDVNQNRTRFKFPYSIGGNTSRLVLPPIEYGFSRVRAKPNK